MTAFRVGDVVRLRGQPQRMTVVRVPSRHGENIRLAWVKQDGSMGWLDEPWADAFELADRKPTPEEADRVRALVLRVESLAAALDSVDGTVPGTVRTIVRSWCAQELRALDPGGTP